MSRQKKRLIRELDELERRLNERIEQVYRRLLDHLLYHQENEHRWGVIKLIRDHPIKTILISLMLGRILLSSVNINDLLELIKALF